MYFIIKANHICPIGFKEGRNMKKSYVDSNELEEWWHGWNVTGDDKAWNMMSEMIYKICEGVSTKFHPNTKTDEHIEHTHDAFIQTLDKIKSGKLRFIHGKAPVFNLLTTTVFRILYSKMNRQKKQKEHLKKYTYDCIQKNTPEMLPMIEYPYGPPKESKLEKVVQ
jgi:hypothetical protein